MKWIEAKIFFTHADKEVAVALIADAFDGIDVRGVVVEDPDDEPAEGWGDGRVFRPEHHAVIGYFPGDRSAAAKRRQLETAVRNLDATAGVRCRITYGEMDEEDWAESWKAFFWPEKISPRLVVKPTWRPYQARADEIVLEIDPGMAFGTGTHPTTRLCLLAMEAHLRKGHRVLDIGTGSGILLVAAAKLGAGRLCGIDTDPVAVDIARENLQRNGVGPDRYALYHGSLAAVKENAFDLMVANILSEVIIDLLPDVPGALKKNGLFICSGIIEKNAPPVRSRMADMGFDILDERHRESWVCLVGRWP